MASVAVKDRNPSSKSNGAAFYEHAGATLLSEQPAVPAKPKPKSNSWPMMRNLLENRLSGLRAWRNSWWYQNWIDLATYILPRRSAWLTQSNGNIPSPNSMSRGREINQAIVDPTATFATRVCAAGLMSGLASPSRPWFKVIPALSRTQIDAAGRAWLDEVEERLYSVLAGSNFYNSFAQECEDLVVYGTSLVIVYEDEEDLIRCYNPAMGEFYLSCSGTMRIDGAYRNFVMTVAQIVDFFGADNCPEEVQVLWRQKGNVLEQEMAVAHSIEPNFAIDGITDAQIPGKFTWRETYWLLGKASEKPLSRRGFVTKPFTAARWATQSNDAYGRSAGMDVLPDVIQLQVMTRRQAEAIEKMVRPPLIADPELKNQPTSSLPGHVTYSVKALTASSGMRPIYTVMPDVNHLSANIEKIEARIKVGLFNDLFLMLEQHDGQMTAYEVAAKLNEKMQVIGPAIENLNDNLRERLKRIYSIAQKKRIIGPPPPSLSGMPLEIEFTSMLALAQKGAATGGMERLIALVGSMVPVFPSVKDNIDPDAFIVLFNNLLGNAQKILRGPEQVAQMRADEAKKAQQAQTMAALDHGAQIANTGAQAGQTLSQTQVGAGGNALAMMLGQGGAK